MNAYGKLSFLAAAVILLLPSTLSAQGHPGMGADSMSMDATMMQPGPRMLLHQQDMLGLSEGQVRQLQEIQARIDNVRAEALGVLTDEQRSNVRYGMRMMMRGMEGRTGMMGAQAGMMRRMGAREQAPMMDMMHRMHRQMHEMHADDCPMAPDAGDEN